MRREQLRLRRRPCARQPRALRGQLRRQRRVGRQRRRERRVRGRQRRVRGGRRVREGLQQRGARQDGGQVLDSGPTVVSWTFMYTRRETRKNKEKRK